MKYSGVFYDGRENIPQTGEFFPVYSPYDGSLVGQASRAFKADLDFAVKAANAGFKVWKSLPVHEKELLFLKAANILEAKSESLIDLIVKESGSTFSKAEFELNYSASVLRAAAGEVRRLYGDTFPNDKPHRISMVLREPLGVVGVISPFNAPLVLLVKMAAFPLAAGNTVIAKPSELTPLIAMELAQVFKKAGFPKGVFNVLTGYGPEIGVHLCKHPKVHGIAFTGSTEVGIKVGKAAMEGMKVVQLELGGKNPLLILKDFDPLKAAEMAAAGAFFHSGQICMSSSRLIVEEPIAEEFIDALVKKANSLHLGDLWDSRTAYGPLINQDALEKVQKHVKNAKDSGAKVLSGGEVHSGLIYKPTIVFDPPVSSNIWKEETFGPLVVVKVARDLEEAINLANDSFYGLSAGILTNDTRRGFKAVKEIRCGSVHLGMHSFQSDTLAPVGGFGLSGMGKSGGKYSTEEFTRLKWVSIEMGETPLPF